MLPVAIQELPFQAKDSYQQNRRHHSSTKLNKKQASGPHQQSHVIEMTIERKRAWGWHSSQCIGAIPSHRRTLQLLIPPTQHRSLDNACVYYCRSTPVTSQYLPLTFPCSSSVKDMPLIPLNSI